MIQTKPPELYEIVTRENAQGQKERGIKLNLHEGQQNAHDSDKRIVAIISGTQAGKTSYLPWWLYREICRKGPGDYLAVTATFDLFKIKMLPTMREVMEHTLGIARYWAGDQILEICEHDWSEQQGVWVPKPGVFRANQSGDPMWARIILRSASSEGGLESATAKAACLDEAGLPEFGLGAWEAIMRRLSLNRGRILITTTPYNTTGWLKRQVFDKWKAGDENIDVFQFASIMNPQFPKEEFEERKRDMQDHKFKMMYEGQFERPAGMVYPDYSDTIAEIGGHLIEPRAFPKGMRRVLGVDPGPVYYTLLYGIIEEETNTLTITRERQFSYRSTAEIVNIVLREARENNIRFSAFYVGGKPDVQARLDWRNAGAFPVYDPPFAAIEDGIDKVTHLIRNHQLRVFSTCNRLRDQFMDYRRKLDPQGVPLEQIDNPQIYHYMDALRYIAAGMGVSRAVTMDEAPETLASYRGDIA